MFLLHGSLFLMLFLLLLFLLRLISQITDPVRIFQTLAWPQCRSEVEQNTQNMKVFRIWSGNSRPFNDRVVHYEWIQQKDLFSKVDFFITVVKVCAAPLTDIVRNYFGMKPQFLTVPARTGLSQSLQALFPLS